ncbi:MAG: short chain dehydrogenase [Pseudomonadales bacterium]|nr:short chain dehydrogenase [Pseudomonadales bacterium]MCK5791732.1 NAD(P)-dependent oxidoreductase [Ketobacter sp.]MEC8813016.1 NAD(P)-dependent oxidoreductase [Pseudomonadota bacterium]HAG92955.1 short chain dehydrogenase [Gammaproteobacteria bacterium]HAU12260.1 short chain dehydrogenase [Gammaproteobacteria bacterium]|tara:strand:+ start:34923 stop:35771 length:849 start_codon:yes stop_codon:yes gene_type:complete
MSKALENLANKTLFITGASRGIGKEIALKAARDGANIVVAAKTAEPHPKLDGTIYTAAEEIEAAGGKALPLVVDVREEDQVAEAIQRAVDTFGGIDILVNNASAINLSNTLAVEMKRFDLMHQINFRGTFLCSKLAVPHLKNAENPHVLNLAPPLSTNPRWFAPHLAYSMAKFGMSFCVLGMAEEFSRDQIAFNALWPRTAIATAAVQNHLGGDATVKLSRLPTIMADAAYEIFKRPSAECSGNFFIDDEVMAEAGVTDLRHYQVDTSLEINQLIPDFFIDQ